MRGIVAVVGLLLAIWALPVAAQDTSSADRSFLTGFLEDNLSGAGRTVRVEGFAGALSSRATFSSLTFADDQGVWLTIRNGALSWNRSALLSGRIEISEMSADEIVMDRRPVMASSGASWSAGAGFSLPELPVSVQIDKISAAKLDLGAEVLGEPVTMSLDGTVSLAGGAGEAKLDVMRTDGRDGKIAFRGSFSNASQIASLDLLAREGADGLAANLLAIPGRPALQLAVNGTGPLGDLTLDLGLVAANKNSITGKVSLKSVAGDGGAPPSRRVSLDISGNVAPLFLPAYQAFFGDKVNLAAVGQRADDGRITLENLAISSSALAVTGALTLTPDYLPERAALTLQLGLDGSTSVVLPLPGAPTSVQNAILNVGYDAAISPDWSVGGKISGLSRPGLTVTTLKLDGAGRFVAGQAGDQVGMLDGKLAFVAGGIALADPAMATAIGPFLSGKARLHWLAGEPLGVSEIAVIGQGYAAHGDLTVAAQTSGVVVGGKVTGDFRNLAQLSGLAGRVLGGSGKVAIDGQYAPISGAFDATASVTGADVSVGMPALDGLLVGPSQIDISAARDRTGLTLRSLRLAANGVSATAQGKINADAVDLTVKAALPDLSLVGGGVRGRVEADATVTGQPDDLKITAQGISSDLAVGNASADRLLAGTSTLNLSGGISQAGVSIGLVDLKNRAVSLNIKGRGVGLSQPLDVEGRLNDVGLLTPAFSGPLTLRGTVAPRSGGYDVDLAAQGPGNTLAKITGRTNSFFSQVDLRAAGTVQSAIANPFIGPATIGGPATFGLRMLGKPALANLTGNIGLRAAQIAVPEFGVSLGGVSGTAQLANGGATVTGSGNVTGGGTVSVSGTLGLAPPRNADLKVALASAHLRNPQLFDTSASGNLSVTGPLAGGPLVTGQISLGDTEIRLASAGFGGSSTIGTIHHIGDKPSVKVTRARAGLDGRPGVVVARSAPIRLNIDVAATRRIFVRGRGLDAELGGQVQLRGTTADVQPNGEFGLVRGRLDLLGKRFEITEGDVRLQGALVPTLHFVASTTLDDTVASIIISGSASAPTITFESQPQLPEEEVVSRLLFQRSLTSLSPFQAAQLASAVATLTGRGGDGIVERLRKSFGLDDFDVATATDGTLALRAGKYLTGKVYTDVTVDQTGKSVIRLNLDLSRSVTARGHVSTDGTSGIGVYYDRDY